MKISAVIFDMDGVIFDTERLSRYVWKLAEKEFHFTCDEDFFKRLTGVNHKNVLKIYADYFGDAARGQMIYDWRRAHTDRIIETDGIALKPGLVEILDYLEEHHIPIALATSSNASRVAFLFAHSPFQNPFKVMITGDMLQHSKPHPEIFQRAAAELGIPIQECMVIEDSPNGILAGYAAGAVTVMVPDQIVPAEEIIEKTFSTENSLFAVINLLERINNGGKDNLA